MAVVMVVVGYISGSVPSGLVIGRMVTGRDVRLQGSGNIGAANVSRLAGTRVAFLVLLVDVAKGLWPVLAGRALGFGALPLAAVALACVLGHDYSLFLRLHGGKGVATTLGVFLGLQPLAAVYVAIIWLGVVAATRYSSVASLVSLSVLPIGLWLVRAPLPFVVLSVALALLAILRHRDNIRRLVRGEETRMGRGVK